MITGGEGWLAIQRLRRRMLSADKTQAQAVAEENTIWLMKNDSST